MTSPIQQNNAASCLQSSRLSASMLQKGYGSYQEALAERSAANISLTTAEGDVVVISNNQAQAYSVAAERWSTPLQQGMNFTATALNSSSFNLAVSGDLSEEELADIQNLLTDLSAIAGSFFSGDLGQAMDEAMNIGDMGSIAQLSASFSYTAKWTASAQMTDYHPLPTAGDQAGNGLEDIFATLPEVIDQARTDELKYAEMLQAQWQQIKSFLDAKETEEVAPQDSPVAREQHMPAARQLMSRIEETVARHPRLAPFSLPLVHEAIDKETENGRHPALFGRKNMLKDNFLQELNKWMYAV
ncbi:MAG: hypothetical protein HY789_00880 [Deltaproteobacteria bacterium]|nr:hypothetical protein [Deltaproteobacteria bacterium]